MVKKDELSIQKACNRHAALCSDYQALIAVIRQYTKEGAIVFAVAAVALLAADRYVENQHLKEEEGKEDEGCPRT
jgi:hypothetical protein